jgi:hypothetical protein
VGEVARRAGGATRGGCGVGKMWAGWMIHLVAVFSTG